MIRSPRSQGECDGAIVGSAIVKIIGQEGSHADEKLADFITSVASAVHLV